MAVTFSGTSANGVLDGGATTLDVGITVPSGSGIYVFAGTGGWDGGTSGTMSAAIVSGSALATILQQDSGGDTSQHLALFGLAGVSPGAITVRFTYPATSWHIGAIVAVYFGVNSSAPIGTPVGAGVSGANAAHADVQGTSLSNMIVGAVTQWASDPANYSPYAGVAQRAVGNNWLGDGESVVGGDMPVDSTITTDTIGWTWTGAASAAKAAAVELLAASAAASKPVMTVW
jgi:hypothetical protein